MVMGPTHSMSGAAGWLVLASLAGTAIGTLNTDSVPVLVMGTFIAAGAALAPDIDSHTSTVRSSFGVFGTIGYNIANAISLFFYNLTATRRDERKSNGHRTFFHTGIVAILAGVLVFLGSSMTSTVDIQEKTFTHGQLFSLFVMFIFTHLALAGLFEKWVTKNRRKYGPYLMMVVSLVITLVTALFIPEEGNYPWLGIAVAFGWFMHILGDLITKLGVPLLWPLKIRGKRWWDVSLPSILRIRAGGTFEKAVLLPLLTLITIGMSIYLFPGVKEAINSGVAG